MSLATRLSIAAIVHYQNELSAKTGSTCRHFPSCSEYAALALQRYGFVRGCRMALRRVSDCRPDGPRPYVDLP